MDLKYLRLIVASILLGSCVFLCNGQVAKKRKLGEPTYLYTNGNNHWNHAYLSVQDRSSFVFAVKACSSARMILGSNFGASDVSIEIALGEEDNKVSRITYPFGVGEGLFETSTDHILHCDEYREFWVQWLADYIEVGYGNTVSNWKFMNYWDTDFFAVNTIGFTSGDGIAAVWRFAENAGDLLEVATPDEYMYETLWKSVKNRDVFSFQVRACQDAHILLAEEMGEQSTNVYEISIGGWQNNQSVIRSNVYGWGESVKDTEHTPGILSCDSYREFWVGWYNNSVRVGRGDLYPHGLFLHHHDPDIFEVNWVGITTGFGDTGNWLLNLDAETVNVIHTPHSDGNDPVSKYNTSWIESPKQSWIVFEVKSGEEACILLGIDSSLAGEDQDIEVTIGTGDNKDTICVGTVFQPGCYVEAQFNTKLNSEHYTPFWISWINHKFSMGAGWFLNQSVIIQDFEVTQYHYNAVGFATANSWGWWRVRGYYGSRLLQYTPDYFTDFTSHITWRTAYTKDFIQFQVKAPADVHVAISPTVGVGPYEKYYMATIGGWDNSRSVIQEKQGEGFVDTSAADNYAGRLSADEFRDFWVSWYHGFVEVGEGAIAGEMIFLQHQFENLEVRANSFSTGWGAAGEWKLYEDVGDYSTFWTNGTENFKGWSADHWYLIYPYVNWTSFKVMACKDANIYISALEQDSAKVDKYQITIGADDNSKVKIYHEGQEVKSADHYTLSCTHNRDFWISWESGTIKVGRGYIRNFETLAEWTDTEVAFNVSAIGFTAPAGVNARWMVHDRSAGDMEVYTNKDYAYKTWTTVDHHEYMFFALNACSDAHILLSERLNKQHGYSYEIVIGGWNNSRTVIREWLEDEHGQRMPEYVVKDTPGIHNCTFPVLFWVSWENGFIAVGTGTSKERAAYIEYHPITIRPIRAIAFSTGYGFDGIYSIFFNNAFPTPPIEEVPVTEGPTPDIGGDDGLSGGAIAGIVIGCISIVVIIGAIAFLALTYRGVITTPTFLQTPAEGSGFSNPTSGDRSHDFRESQDADA